MTDVEAELREQLSDAFEEATYPIEDQLELASALPSGPSTRFEAGDFSMTAMEMGMKLSAYQDFPYASADELVDDVIRGLSDRGLI